VQNARGVTNSGESLEGREKQRKSKTTIIKEKKVTEKEVGEGGEHWDDVERCSSSGGEQQETKPTNQK